MLQEQPAVLSQHSQSPQIIQIQVDQRCLLTHVGTGVKTASPWHSLASFRFSLAPALQKARTKNTRMQRTLRYTKSIHTYQPVGFSNCPHQESWGRLPSQGTILGSREVPKRPPIRMQSARAFITPYASGGLTPIQVGDDPKRDVRAPFRHSYRNFESSVAILFRIGLHK